jgi:hypothetical protein
VKEKEESGVVQLLGIPDTGMVYMKPAKSPSSTKDAVDVVEVPFYNIEYDYKKAIADGDLFKVEIKEAIA